MSIMKILYSTAFNLYFCHSYAENAYTLFIMYNVCEITVT
jgi:hypothetical protein